MVLLSVTSLAHAEEPAEDEPPAGIQIDRPHVGSRPVTLDMHAGLLFYGPGAFVGARLALPIAPNGFVPSINNSVALVLGADLYYARYLGELGEHERGIGFGFPLGLQWSFFFSEKFSAFATLGVNIYFPASFVAGGDAFERAGGYVLAEVGGRVHFSPRAAFVFRVGNPYTSVGFQISF